MKWISNRALEQLRSVAAHPDFSQTKYQLVRELGRGGMGTVYEAVDNELDRKVALKVLAVADATDDDVRRMVHEAQIIAQLEHPGIIPVHDVGKLPDGRVYYAMKLVRGCRLDEYINQPVTTNDVLRKFHAVCDAVGFAHAHSVIHRDLKPQNIMVGSFGEVLVLDWGVAKVVHQSTTEFPVPDNSRRTSNNLNSAQSKVETMNGTIIGTESYMSPEQSAGQIDELDARSDIYSLGAMLYFLLTRRNPAPSTLESQGIQQLAVSLRAINPQISKGAAAVCQKAMSRSKGARYQTVKEFSEEIERLLDSEPVLAYKENLFEKLLRWLGKNKFLVLLVLAYLMMRIFLLLANRS